MSIDIRNKLIIERKRLDELNSFLTNPKNKLVNNLLAIVEKYGEIVIKMYRSQLLGMRRH